MIDGVQARDDATLARDAAEGDPEALRRVLERVAGRLRKIAWNLSRDHHHAEDLCQEAMIRITDPRVLRSYQGTGPLEAYLVRCGARAMISVIRTRRMGTGAESPSDNVPETADPAAAVEDLAGAAHLAPGLRDAMMELPERARMIVLLLAVGELTYSETAEAVGVPVGTVRSTYARARDRLATELHSAERAS
jgi:RNA polymerase sigma-70 factor (ECF subfamily)